ncbi:MAG: adenosylmethionine--8-amino-7-oxononanoate transaminase, partial [Candidatus Aegiribacteria sp.]|nr:adenosylmethionine--8-amino-7-oxononanoate transaminase [Candidatus Aegiribacteria sp.]MBD3294019.1 adenosylmethionine--8-amino-7-oxononanoate transaminase [Candidatus Fermentibacteria bacterium]
MKTTEDLRVMDRRHLWHPYTDIESFQNSHFCVIERGKGVYLEDTDGRRILDGISSWWCVNLGHCHPAVVRAVQSQADKLLHSITGGMSHEKVIELAGKLAEIAPGELSRVYLASDGASSVEAALRMALQYWWNLGRPEKKELVSLEAGYHGDTLGCAGLGYMEKFHRPIRHVLNRSLTGPSPHCFHCPFHESSGSCSLQCFAALEEVIVQNADTIAAVIVEPVCQGAAGMRIYPPEHTAELRRVCSACDVLMILDEIAVGFGRTGRMFASELAAVVPDMMCVGKGLTGGTLPMSGVVLKESIYDAFRNMGEGDRTFYHGHTYSGNPLAAAAASAAMDVYSECRVLENTEMLSTMLKEAFEELKKIEGVHNAASLGCMTALEISGDYGGAAAASAAAEAAVEMGLLIRPLGPVLYLWPPLVT